jgi:DNA-binding NtrC family response regulator
MPKLLIVDDEIGIRELLSEILRDEGYDVDLAENGSVARAKRNLQRPDLVLLDIWMPDVDGITLLKEWAANGQLTMPVIMMSGHGTIDTAVEATRIGAVDFLEKPIALQKLLSTIHNSLQRHKAPAIPAPLTLAAFARSPQLKELKRRLEQVAEKSRAILLRSGPGSLAELCARSLQAPATPWLDLTAVIAPIELSALEAAAGGVIYVAELARLSRIQQKNLAFVLERLERCRQRLVVATEHPLNELQAAGWDERLLARLFEASLAPPSLLEVKDDIPEISAQVLQQLVEAGEVPAKRLSTGAQNVLRNHLWQGGYTELRSTLKSLALAALDSEISADDVARLVHPLPESGAETAIVLPLHLPFREAREAFERLYFEYQLDQEEGNIARVADKSGLERTHLYRKLKSLGLQIGRRGDDHDKA